MTVSATVRLHRLRDCTFVVEPLPLVTIEFGAPAVPAGLCRVLALY
jgi:hypothetical protein